MKKFNVGDLVGVNADGELAKFNGLHLFVVGYYQNLPVISFYPGAYVEYLAVYDAYSATSDPILSGNLSEDLCSLAKKLMFCDEENLVLVRPANNTKD